MNLSTKSYVDSYYKSATKRLGHQIKNPETLGGTALELASLVYMNYFIEIDYIFSML